nr:MAG TPA: hypothetical protein [Caudoviricetes sp.]
MYYFSSLKRTIRQLYRSSYICIPSITKPAPLLPLVVVRGFYFF